MQLERALWFSVTAPWSFAERVDCIVPMPAKADAPRKKVPRYQSWLCGVRLGQCMRSHPPPPGARLPPSYESGSDAGQNTVKAAARFSACRGDILRISWTRPLLEVLLGAPSRFAENRRTANMCEEKTRSAPAVTETRVYLWDAYPRGHSHRVPWSTCAQGAKLSAGSSSLAQGGSCRGEQRAFPHPPCSEPWGHPCSHLV